MRVTIRDVAKAAGTSVSTVSRVINGSTPVSAEKRRAVLDAIGEMDYRPSQVARGLKTKSTRTIGLVINDITNPFYSSIAGAVEEEANRNGYGLMLCHVYESAENELRNLQMLQDKGADGIIFGPTGGNVEYVHKLALNVPLVQVDRKMEGVNAPAVLVDNEKGAYDAVKLLVDRGHQRIGLIRWGAGVHTPKDRTAGYLRALSEAGIDPDPSLIVEAPQFSPKESAHLAEALLKRDPRPSAIFAQNNQLGIGALKAIQQMGLRIPQDIALVVFDDIDTFTLTTPPITAVAQPTLAIGRRAMQLLMVRIENPKDYLSEVVILPTQLILRGSV